MDIQSIESLTALSNALVQQRIDTAVLAKSNDIAKAEGEMALELLDAAANVAQPTGNLESNHSLDLIA